jgi:thiol-disulfide isomerase/thioredoxin
MRRRAAAIAIGLALALAGCGGAQRSGPPISIGFTPIDGGSITTGELRGRAVVLHLFTTWSLAAQGDVPQLQEAAERHAGRAVVLGVGLDPDGRALLAPWRKVNEISYLVAATDDAFRASLADGSGPLGAVIEVPTTIVLDADGRVAGRVDGPLPPGELERLLARALPSR